MIILLKGNGIPNLPEGYKEYVWIYSEVALIVTCGLDGVVGLCSTLHQQGSSLTGPHGHSLVVHASLAEFPH